MSYYPIFTALVVTEQSDLSLPACPQLYIFHVATHPQFPWYTQCVDFGSYPSPAWQKVSVLTVALSYWARNVLSYTRSTPLCKNTADKLIVFLPIFPKMADLAGCGWLVITQAGRSQTAKIQAGNTNFTPLCMMQHFLEFRDSLIITLRRSPFRPTCSSTRPSSSSSRSPSSSSPTPSSSSPSTTTGGCAPAAVRSVTMYRDEI